MIKWIEILSTQAEELKTLAASLNVHPLALEDCLHRDQQPKLEDYETHKLLVWFMLAKGHVYEIQFLIFDDQILMVPHEKPPECMTWREYLKVSDNQKDSWHMLYQAIDRATDVTWQEVWQLFYKLDEFEQKMFKSDVKPQSLLLLKKKLNQIDYSIGNLSTVARQLQNSYHVKDDLRWKLRDLFDHCERLNRSITLYKSQIATTIELFWGLQANRTNRQIKKLSLLASLAVPLTFWTSFWGMNFGVIPFSNPGLFWLAILLMALTVGGTAWFLIRRGYWTD